jgi:hypothetical protein
MDRSTGSSRLDRGMEHARAFARRTGLWARELLHHPVRLLIGGICIVLLAVALPLLVGGGARLYSAWNDWRHDRAVGRDWISSTATIQEVRDRDGLVLRLAYRDRAGTRHTATVVVDSGSEWIASRTPIRYDPNDAGSVDLVDVVERPVGNALVAGAAIGAGLAAVILAIAIWRKRRVLEESGHPFTVLRVPLALSAIVLAFGIAAWAAGTVHLRGWTGVADRLGHQFSIVFGDMLGVTVPLVAFALGCLLTAWLARHRHHEDHEGILSRAHRLIDRAAGYVPSPEELQAQLPDRETGASPAAGADEPEPGAASGDPAASEDEVRTGR